MVSSLPITHLNVSLSYSPPPPPIPFSRLLLRILLGRIKTAPGHPLTLAIIMMLKLTYPLNQEEVWFSLKNAPALSPTIPCIFITTFIPLP